MEVVRPREVPEEVVKPRDAPKEVVKSKETVLEVVKPREAAVEKVKPKEASMKEGGAVCLKFGQVPPAAVKPVDCITLSSDEEGAPAPQDAEDATVKEEEISRDSPEVILLILYVFL